MKIFEVLLTRDCTQSVTVKVMARTRSEAREKALNNAPDEGWSLDDGNFWKEFYITGVCEAYLPEWAETEILDGSYLHVRASLLTKDGRVCGNATIVKIGTSKYDDTPLAIVVTDAGNILKLNENELKDFFHPPQYIMRHLLPAHWYALESFMEESE